MTSEVPPQGRHGPDAGSGRVEPAKVEADWKKRGFSFGVWTDPPGQVWENYVHETDELFIVIEGRVELEMQGRRFCPPAGEEVLIPACVTHSVRNVGGSTSRWLYGYRKTG